MHLKDVAYRDVDIDASINGQQVVFERCRFTGCSIGMKNREVNDRVRVSNVLAKNCTVDSVTVGAIVFDRLLIENLETVDHLWLNGCAFVDCVVRGDIGCVLAFEEIRPLEPRTSRLNRLFIDDNRAIYSATSMALDIKDAQFADLDLRSVPAELVRVNNLNQFRMDYAKAKAIVGTKQFNRLEGKSLIESYLEDREESEMNFVATAHPRHPQYEKRLELFDFLRRNGVTF